MRTTSLKTNATKTALLDAAKKVLMSEGYSGLSTRAVAAAADTQMSQIRYHFGSKEGLVLALYEFMTEQLIERQSNVFADKTLSLSQKWNIACDYLDTDIETGYVRVFQELLAQGWSNPRIAKVVVTTLRQWFGLHLTLAKEFQQTSGSFGPFEAEDIALLIGPAFVGVESFILLGWDEESAPIRRALRRFGKVIQHFEDIEPGGN